MMLYCGKCHKLLKEMMEGPKYHKRLMWKCVNPNCKEFNRLYFEDTLKQDLLVGSVLKNLGTREMIE
jgi:phage FluMu protein Com